MAFITQTDFQQICRDSIIEKLIDNNDAIFEQAVDSAIAQATEYLAGLYDTDAIFSGVNRNAFMVRGICYITRYVLYDRAPGLSMGKGEPTKSEADYRDFLQYLKDLSSGSITSTLPRKQTTTTEGTSTTASNFRWGGVKRGDSLENDTPNYRW